MTETNAPQESLSAHRLEVARELLDDIELGRLAPESLLLKASRLARIMDATEVQEWLRLELKGYSDPDTSVYKKYSVETGRLTNKPNPGHGYWEPFAALLARSRAMEIELQGLKIPDVNFAPSSANPKEYVAGFVGQHVQTATGPANAALTRMTALTSSITICRSTTSKIMAVLHDFITKTYYELAFRDVAESIFEAHKKHVDALLAASAGEALQKIPAISERLAAGDTEAISQALSTCRRVLHAFADSVQPPTTEKLRLGDKLLEGGADKYMNRIGYFLRQNCKSKSREDRLHGTVKALYERFCAGTHDDVTAGEARALFVILYVTLGEVLSLSQTTS